MCSVRFIFYCVVDISNSTFYLLRIGLIMMICQARYNGIEMLICLFQTLFYINRDLIDIYYHYAYSSFQPLSRHPSIPIAQLWSETSLTSPLQHAISASPSSVDASNTHGYFSSPVHSSSMQSNQGELCYDADI